MTEILVGAIGAVLGVAVGYLVARAMHRVTRDRVDAATQGYACEACQNEYRTKAEALHHAMTAHKAPDRENAEYIIYEVSG